LLNNADFTIKNFKGKIPKEVTKNQRIIYLIEKYEKRVSKTTTNSFHSSISNEEEKEAKSSERRQSVMMSGSSQNSLRIPTLNSIREADIIYEEEEIEN
jgi:hypothetical protein